LIYVVSSSLPDAYTSDSNYIKSNDICTTIY